MTVNGQMQAKCWKGQHPFDWEDISFEQEILADDNTLNFCVPLYFDTYSIFGEEVSKLGPDDSFNVYANYNLDEGEISDYLEISVICSDGHEDIAYYQLSPEEQAMFLRKMDAYCQETAGITLSDWEQQYMQEQREPQQQPEM